MAQLIPLSDLENYWNHWGLISPQQWIRFIQIKSNGSAEAAVKKYRRLLKLSKSDVEFFQASLAWNNTPILTGRPSPSQIHFGRNLRDKCNFTSKQSQVDWNDVHVWRTNLREAQKKTYDRHAKPLPELKVGEKVLIWLNDQWNPGEVEKSLPRPRSYLVKNYKTGNLIERNRVHLRKHNIHKFENVLIVSFPFSSRTSLFPSLSAWKSPMEFPGEAGFPMTTTTHSSDCLRRKKKPSTPLSPRNSRTSFSPSSPGTPKEQESHKQPTTETTLEPSPTTIIPIVKKTR